jgi:adenosylmethionine-8-amino-7-oxononanoate aminotransferase
MSQLYPFTDPVVALENPPKTIVAGRGCFVTDSNGKTYLEAVDTAAKLMRFYQNARNKPDKKKIVARDGAYHGSGHTSAALTGISYCHAGFDLPDQNILRTGRPHYYADADPEMRWMRSEMFGLPD